MRTMIARWFERIRIGRANSYLKVCLFICMLLSVSSVKASSFTVNGVSYETISDTTCKVVAGDEAYEGMVNIPSEVSYNSVAYKVSSIGDQAFLNCGGLMDVSLPESLEEIGSEAFGYCYALTAISIPDNVKRIDKSAFIGTNLQNLYIGDCINRIGMSAFSFVPSVHLTSSISKINDVAFEDADDLRYIYIPNSVKEMEANAFAFCGNLQCVYIDDLANWCEIKFGNVQANPISKCREFWVNDSHITNLEIPNGVISISSYAFYGCDYLYELKLPDSVEKIGDYAFYDCHRLSSLYLGTGLKQIGSNAIRHYQAGHNVYIRDLNAFCQIDVEDGVSFLDRANLIYNDKTVTRIELEDGITKIGQGIFSQYENLTSISMPNSVTSIGRAAFSNCHGLIKVTLSDSIKVIPSYCFNCATNLSKINFPKELREIEDYAFSGCGLDVIVLPDSTIRIGENAFSYCLAKSIVLSDRIKALHRGTFSNCKNLIELNLGNGVEFIENGCILDCPEIESIYLPSSLKNLEYNFYGCNKLKHVYCNANKPFNAYFHENLLQQATLYVPMGCKKLFLEDNQWNRFSNIVEMDGLGAVEEISTEFFQDDKFEIYDYGGKRILSSEEDLKAGVYILKHGKQLKKIVVK